MDKILTQEEIDALLASAKPRAAATTRAGRPSRATVVPYDFKHPDRISKEQVRTLRTIHDGFARMFATYLSATLRTMVDVNLLSIDQVTFSEYTLSLSVPNALYILNLEKLDGRGLIQMSPQFLLFVVDRLLGGVGDPSVAAREISQLEQNVVRRVVQTVVGQLNDVWKPVSPLDAKLEGFETDPQFVQIARASDTLAVIFFEIRARETAFQMHVVFPYFVLEPILNKLTAQGMMALTGKKTVGDERERIQTGLRLSRLPLRAVLARTALKVRDFMELEPDDIIHLDKKITDPLEVLVGGKVKFLASAGKRGRRRAVRIIRVLTPDEEAVYGRK